MAMKITDPAIAGLRGKTIFLDIDGTLTHAGGAAIAPEVEALVRSLQAHNDVHLLSNRKTPGRVSSLADALGIRGIDTAHRKPDPRTVAGVVRTYPEAVVIGDKVLTDGLLAFFIGATYLRVSRIVHPDESSFDRALNAADDLAAFGWFGLALMRPLQWVKNLLVFAPLFFAQALFWPGAFAASLMAFIGFSLAASAVYIVNDLCDIERDRLHPKKRGRPLASGMLSMPGALLLLVVVSFLEAAVLYAVPALIPILITYVILNVAYSMRLKHIAVLDILLVASFYLMRVIAGGVATAIPLSPWIILCVFFAALFVIVGKRRAEQHQESRRAVLDAYSGQALDFMLVAAATLSVISYGVYTIIGHDSPYLLYTTFFVVLAFFRTLNRIYTHPENAEAPETMLFKDPWIFASFALWALSVFAVFYLLPG